MGWVKIDKPTQLHRHHMCDEENSWSEDVFQLKLSIQFMIFEKRKAPGAMVNGVIFFAHCHTVSTDNPLHPIYTHFYVHRTHTCPAAVCGSVFLLLTRQP